MIRSDAEKVLYETEAQKIRDTLCGIYRQKNNLERNIESMNMKLHALELCCQVWDAEKAGASSVTIIPGQDEVEWGDLLPEEMYRNAEVD